MHCLMFAIIRVTVFICDFMQGCTVVTRQLAVVTEFFDSGPNIGELSVRSFLSITLWRLRISFCFSVSGYYVHPWLYGY